MPQKGGKQEFWSLLQATWILETHHYPSSRKHAHKDLGKVMLDGAALTKPVATALQMQLWTIFFQKIHKFLKSHKLISFRPGILLLVILDQKFEFYVSKSSPGTPTYVWKPEK